MKKIFILSIMAILFLVPLTGAVNVTNSIKDDINSAVENVLNADFTHTVLAEYGSKNTCPLCPPASNQLYDIYNSGDYDFYYVTLVYLEEGGTPLNVIRRLQELEISGVPDVHFDGKYMNVPGKQSNDQPYRNAINQSGEREVPDIDIDIDVSWLGFGTLKITVAVYDNEIEEFKGYLRTYIVEEESRWDDQSGNPYHYAVLDIPINRNLALVRNKPRPIGGSYEFTKTWLGALHGFGDITKENIMIIGAVFDKDSEVVQTASATPSSSGSMPHHVFRIFLEKFPNVFPIIKHLFGL